MSVYDYAARDKEAVEVCNLCGSTDHVELTQVDRYGFPATMRICTRCGLGFLSPRLTAAEYGEFYEDVYRPLVSAYHGRRIDAETVQVDQRLYAAELVGFLRKALRAPPASVKPPIACGALGLGSPAATSACRKPAKRSDESGELRGPATNTRSR